jgi:hypothetical protein
MKVLKFQNDLTANFENAGNLEKNIFGVSNTSKQFFKQFENQYEIVKVRVGNSIK